MLNGLAAAPQDLPRTFPTNVWMPTREAQGLLERVLLAYSMHNPSVRSAQASATAQHSNSAAHPVWRGKLAPCRKSQRCVTGANGCVCDVSRLCASTPIVWRAAQVGYCQGLNYLAGMLLLVLQKDEERAFWILVSLLDEGGSAVK